MTDQNYNTNQEGQKTIVAFVVGLLIGGLIVWMFTGSPADAPVETGETNTQTEAEDNNTESENTEDETTTNDDTETETQDTSMDIGDGSVTVSDQTASSVITLESVTYPMSEGWIGVREYTNDRLGNILGVVRFSEEEGLVPEEIVLQRSTTPGNEYAIVFYTAGNGSNFNLATNVQVEGVFATFTAE